MAEGRRLSVVEIAECSGIKRATVYKSVYLNRIPSHIVGNLRKFRISKIDNWVRSGKVGSEVGKNAHRRFERKHHCYRADFL